MLTISTFLFTIIITYISGADVKEFFKTRCNSSCTYLKANISKKYVEAFPILYCDTLCAHVVIDENTDLSEKQLTWLFKDIKTLYGSLTITNTKLTNGRFLTSLETIECEPDGSFCWENNELMTEIGMTNLTRCYCQIYLNGNTKISMLNLPKLEYFSPSNKTNQQEVDMIIYNMGPDFCLSIYEMTKFIKNENLHMSNIPEKFCSVGSTLISGMKICEYGENSTMKSMPEDCTIIVGNARLENGEEQYMYKLKSMKYLFGTFVLFNTNLTSFELPNLEYVVSLSKDFEVVAVKVQVNYDLTKFSLPSLKRVRSVRKTWIEFDYGNNKNLFKSVIHEKTICDTYMDIRNETELYYSSINGWRCEMCLECKLYSIANDFDAFSPVILTYIPEKYYTTPGDEWSPSVTSYTGYDNVWEFLTEVKRYACFPESCFYFGMSMADPFPTEVRIHHKLDTNVKYIYKQQILSLLQMDVNNLECDHNYDLRKYEKLFVNSVIGFFLKSINLESLEGNFELVPYQESVFMKFSEHLEQELKNAKPVHKLTGSTNCDEIMRKLETILPANRATQDLKPLLKMVESCGVQPSNSEFFERCLNRVLVIIHEINGFINAIRELVLPQTLGPNFIPTVRVFDDGNDGVFVLVHELLREMKAAKLDTSKIKVETGMPDLRTENFESIREILGDDFDKITFVSCTILNISRRASFMPSINGKFCFKVSNFLLEILGEMITAYGYFQNLNSTHWDMLSPLFDELANRIETEANGCLLIETRAALEIKKWMLEETAKVFACRPKKTKEIRTIRGDWFTVKDVKNELKRLGIIESFDHGIESDMINEAYRIITSKREPEWLPSRWFYETLQMIQTTLVMDKFEKIWHQFHVCGDCNYLLFECVFCEGYDLPSENQSQKKAEKKKEKKKRQAEKKKLAKEGRKAVEEVVLEQGATEEVNAAEQHIVETPSAPSTPRAAPVALESDLTTEATQQIPVPDQSVSHEPVSEKVEQPTAEFSKHALNSCSKCYRTSQHCEMAKTAFREEKIKTKALNKEVAKLAETIVEKNEQLKRKDETISEKDEEIRLLKEKLAAMEASLLQSGSKSADQPSTSNQAEEDEENDQPDRYLTPTYKNSELSVETRAKFNELLNIRDSHSGLERQARKKTRALISKSEDFGIRRMASRELVQLLSSYESYFQVVEDNINWIQKHKNGHLDQLTTLPDLPKFSDNFETVYDEVVNEELSDKQCPVCIEEIEDLSGTIKCKCKKRYHVHCAWDMDVNGFKCWCKRRLPLD